MTIRRVASIICRTIAGIGSLFVSLYGVYEYAGSHLSLYAIQIALFCFLPLLSFPVVLLSFWRQRMSVGFHWAFALGYLTVFSMLDWRTCAELGYCTSVAATVLETLATRPVEATFAVAILNLCALLLYSRTRLKAR
jgi:hypothetical protein